MVRIAHSSELHAAGRSVCHRVNDFTRFPFQAACIPQESKIDHPCDPAMPNTMKVQIGPLSKKRILSVKCPVCRAKPREKCTMTTGHPSNKTHLDRGLAAAKVPRPERSGRAFLRSVQALTSQGLRILFQRK
jgi:hypothetical protein